MGVTQPEAASRESSRRVSDEAFRGHTVPPAGMIPWVFLTMAALGLVGANLHTSLDVVKSGYFGTGQIVAQLVLIWMVPLVGAGIVWAMLCNNASTGISDHRWTPDRSDKFGPGDDYHQLGGGADGMGGH